MELDLNSSQEFYLRKNFFNLKTNRSDGLILKVHHAYLDSGGGSIKFRFIYSSFSSSGDHLAVSDHEGHTFIINLEAQRYWQLPKVGLCTVISFIPSRNQELLIGLGTTSVILVDVETGNKIGVLSGHSLPATEVSYSDDGCYYLTSCSAEAIVWDSTTFTQVHKLTLKINVFLKKVLFMPVTNHILACFQDDTMHIWKFGSFECIKQIVPETWKTHHLNSIAVTKNGRTMVIGGQSSTLVTFCLETWHVRNVIEFPESNSGVKQLDFLSEAFDGGANRILVVLTTLHQLFFFDTESFVTLKCVSQISGLAAKFSLNCSGKYLAVILTTGEVNIYTVDKILWSKNKADGEGRYNVRDSASRTHSSSSKRSQKTFESLNNIQREIKDILNVKKLLPILKQFGEYPQTYRRLIWKTILKLPENEDCFFGLSLKKCHPSYTKIDMKYPLANTSLCNSLKRLLSNLSYWCPLFGEVDFLPEFVFPFVKLFHSSPLICFEVVGTIIINWCQNWFEFYPFPPVNILSLLESILGYYDPDLLEFYLKNNITSGVFVCPLFHTAFSEVLSKTEWLKLWDHILSNEPSFLFMAIIAYNVVCRNTIKSLKHAAEVEKYFHTQSAIDLKMLINKSYQFLKETPEDIHMRHFFAPFRTLGSGGTYVSFLSYPKLLFDSTTEKLQIIRKEEEKVLDEQFKALSVKKALEEKLQQDDNAEEKKKIYRELEEKIRKTVEEEEERLLAERQKLQKLRQELKLKELEILENTRDKVLKEKISQKKLEYDRLIKDISKRQHREKLEEDTVEKEIKSYYSDLLLRKTQLELDLGFGNDYKTRDNLETQRETLQKDLTNVMSDLQYEWDSHYHSRRIDISNKIATIKSLICDVEGEIAKEMAEKKWEKDVKDNRTFVGELKDRVLSLENEVESLIRENMNNFQSRCPHSCPPKTSENLSRRCEPSGKVNKEVTTQTVVKNLSQKLLPGSRPDSSIITIHPRLPRANQKECSNEKPYFDLPSEGVEGILKSPEFKFSSAKPEGPHKRSKYTQPHEFRLSNSNLPDNSVNFYDSNPEEMQCHQQPKGDCLYDKNLSPVPKFYKNEIVSNFKIAEGAPLSDNADEILNSALRIRREIVEEAKRQHGISRSRDVLRNKIINQ